VQSNKLTAISSTAAALSSQVPSSSQKPKLRTNQKEIPHTIYIPHERTISHLVEEEHSQSEEGLLEEPAELLLDGQQLAPEDSKSDDDLALSEPSNDNPAAPLPLPRAATPASSAAPSPPRATASETRSPPKTVDAPPSKSSPPQADASAVPSSPISTSLKESHTSSPTPQPHRSSPPPVENMRSVEAPNESDEFAVQLMQVRAIVEQLRLELASERQARSALEATVTSERERVDSLQERMEEFRSSVAPPPSKGWEKIQSQFEQFAAQQAKLTQLIDEISTNSRRAVEAVSNMDNRMHYFEEITAVLQQEHEELKEKRFVALQAPLETTGEIWNAVMGHLIIGNVDLAFSTILHEGDALQLIRLMDKTGPALDKLAPTTSSELFTQFLSLLSSHSFIGIPSSSFIQPLTPPPFLLPTVNIFPWLESALDRGMIPLSVGQCRQLLDVLANLSADPNQQGLEATQLFNRVKRYLTQTRI
jgi:hypothetical protein